MNNGHLYPAGTTRPNTALKGRHEHNLARGNGRDKPASARVTAPKTPAARERVSHLVAATKEGGDVTARASVYGGEVV